MVSITDSGKPNPGANSRNRTLRSDDFNVLLAKQTHDVRFRNRKQQQIELGVGR